MKISQELKKLFAVLFAVVIIAGAVGAFFISSNAKNPVATTVENTAPTAPRYNVVQNLVRPDSFSVGPVDAKVTVVEFFDPECETCAKVAPYIKNEIEHYRGKVRWVFRYMPYHFNSKIAIAALESARHQDKFLEVLNILFERQSEWGEKRISAEKEILALVATVPGLDQKKFLVDYKNIDHQKIIERDKRDGEESYVRGTPTFYVNGVMLEQLDLDALIARIETELKR